MVPLAGLETRMGAKVLVLAAYLTIPYDRLFLCAAFEMKLLYMRRRKWTKGVVDVSTYIS